MAAMPVMEAPALRHFTNRDSKASRSSIPSSSACSVNTCSGRRRLRARQTKHRLRDRRLIDAVAPEQLIEGRQRRRYLRTGARAVREQRQERRAAAGVARVAQAIFPLELEPCALICQPAAACDCGRKPNTRSKGLEAALEFPCGSTPHRRSPRRPASARDHRYAAPPRNRHRAPVRMSAPAWRPISGPGSSTPYIRVLSP